MNINDKKEFEKKETLEILAEKYHKKAKLLIEDIVREIYNEVFDRGRNYECDNYGYNLGYDRALAEGKIKIEDKLNQKYNKGHHKGFKDGSNFADALNVNAVNAAYDKGYDKGFENGESFANEISERIKRNRELSKDDSEK